MRVFIITVVPADWLEAVVLADWLEAVVLADWLEAVSNGKGRCQLTTAQTVLARQGVR